jgi:putative DNA modification/repair radical SAM protein
MELLAEVARRLREDHQFGGYIHLKAVPGASEEVLATAGRYADRLSANVELPTQAGLDALAPAKRMTDVEHTMGTIAARRTEAMAERKRSRHAPTFAPAGQSTQMIVGATPASDKTILTSASTLYDRYRLRRVYYSAFSPIPSADPRLPLSAPPLQREHRLYQADWLLRQYGFKLDELFAGGPEDLALDIDPKLAWALRHRHLFPVDLNRAPRELLLRVPGLGTRNVARVLKLRRRRRVVWDDLVRLRAVTKRAAHFVDVPGAPKALGEPESGVIKTSVVGAMQLDLFAAPATEPGPPSAPRPSAGKQAERDATSAGNVAANVQVAAREAFTGEL